MKATSGTITKRSFKKLLEETLRDYPDILEERLLTLSLSF